MSKKSRRKKREAKQAKPPASVPGEWWGRKVKTVDVDLSKWNVLKFTDLVAAIRGKKNA